MSLLPWFFLQTAEQFSKSLHVITYLISSFQVVRRFSHDTTEPCIYKILLEIVHFVQIPTSWNIDIISVTAILLSDSSKWCLPVIQNFRFDWVTCFVLFFFFFTYIFSNRRQGSQLLTYWHTILLFIVKRALKMIKFSKFLACWRIHKEVCVCKKKSQRWV